MVCLLISPYHGTTCVTSTSVFRTFTTLATDEAGHPSNPTASTNQSRKCRSPHSRWACRLDCPSNVSFPSRRCFNFMRVNDTPPIRIIHPEARLLNLVYIFLGLHEFIPKSVSIYHLRPRYSTVGNIRCQTDESIHNDATYRRLIHIHRYAESSTTDRQPAVSLVESFSFISASATNKDRQWLLIPSSQQ